MDYNHVKILFCIIFKEIFYYFFKIYYFIEFCWFLVPYFNKRYINHVIHILINKISKYLMTKYIIWKKLKVKCLVKIICSWLNKEYLPQVTSKSIKNNNFI